MDLGLVVDTAEHKYNREAMKSGTAYTGNRDNFYEGFSTYRKDLRKTLATSIETKLDELNSKSQELPWE